MESETLGKEVVICRRPMYNKFKEPILLSKGYNKIKEPILLSKGYTGSRAAGAGQNISKAVKTVDEHGTSVILKTKFQYCFWGMKSQPEFEG